MLDLETIGEIKTILAEMKNTEAMLHEALLLAELQRAYNKTAQNVHLHHVIHVTNKHYEALAESVKKLTDLAQRMIDQRQSGKEAFNQGWDARLKDLGDRLTGEEFAQLKRALEQIQKQK